MSKSLGSTPRIRRKPGSTGTNKGQQPSKVRAKKRGQTASARCQHQTN